jgi:hypothetical protein
VTKVSPPPDAGVGEDQGDMIAGMLFQQFIAEPQHLCLIGDVADMAGDPHPRRGARSRQRGGLCDGVGPGMPAFSDSRWSHGYASPSKGIKRRCCSGPATVNCLPF